MKSDIIKKINYFRIKKNKNLSEPKLSKLKLKVFDEFYRYILYYNNVYKLDIFVYLYDDYKPNNDKLLIRNFKDFFNIKNEKIRNINYSRIYSLKSYYLDICDDDECLYNDEMFKLFSDFTYYINNFTEFNIEIIDTYLFIIKKKEKVKKSIKM